MTWPNCSTDTLILSQHFPEVSNHGTSSTKDLPSSLLTAVLETGYWRTDAEESHDLLLTLNKVLAESELVTAVEEPEWDKRLGVGWWPSQGL